jgi:hypothetical protein
MAFQIAVAAKVQNMVVSIGPLSDHTFTAGTSFGPDYPIYTISDDAQYQVVIDHKTSYLCADHETIKPAPCSS